MNMKDKEGKLMVTLLIGIFVGGVVGMSVTACASASAQADRKISAESKKNNKG